MKRFRLWANPNQIQAIKDIKFGYEAPAIFITRRKSLNKHPKQATLTMEFLRKIGTMDA